ncbi:hypothetical protein, partial [Rhizobium hidalgonense]
SSSFAKAHHNLKAAGSNPAPATKQIARLVRAFCLVTGRGVNASSGARKAAKPTMRDRKLQITNQKPTFPHQ